MPGAVFRQYIWNFSNTWHRCTDPNATNSGAKDAVNIPNYKTFDDVTDAIKAEACIELLQSHAGTYNKRMRLNDNEWIQIPEAVGIPDGNPECYQTMRYPVVEIPLSHFIEGRNLFKFTNGGQTCYDFGWGQFIFYGVIFRIFYPESIEHPNGAITYPVPGSSFGENPVITAAASSPAGIKQVDFIGYYEDFNYKGDNNWRQWQYTFKKGVIMHHLGTATTPGPNGNYSITWDTLWVPDQKMPMKVMARIIDNNDMCYLTKEVDDLHFIRSGRSVKLYKPYDIPDKWVCRSGKGLGCNADIWDDTDKAINARMIMSMWASQFLDGIMVNRQLVAERVGYSKDLIFTLDIPLDYLSTGTNRISTYSYTTEHGIEVNWPGIAIKTAFE